MKTIFLLRRTNNIHSFLRQVRSKLNKNFLYDYSDSFPCILYICTGENINPSSNTGGFVDEINVETLDLNPSVMCASKSKNN